mgnify:CR=1 FL=1
MFLYSLLFLLSTKTIKNIANASQIHKVHDAYITKKKSLVSYHRINKVNLFLVISLPAMKWQEHIHVITSLSKQNIFFLLPVHTLCFDFWSRTSYFVQEINCKLKFFYFNFEVLCILNIFYVGYQIFVSLFKLHYHH